jgi:hypothetical protein
MMKKYSSCNTAVNQLRKRVAVGFLKPLSQDWTLLKPQYGLQMLISKLHCQIFKLAFILEGIFGLCYVGICNSVRGLL